MPTSKSLIPVERIEKSILFIRGQRVMLDADLAELYGVTTKRLNEQVKRNINRFPKEFMFQLTKEELENWRSQIATSNPSVKMGLRRRSYAFTEYGAVMLANVLKSPTAVEMSILVVKAFIRMRQLLASQKGLMEKILAMEKKYDEQLKAVFEAIRQLMIEEEKPKKRIGFKTSKDD